MVGLRKLPWQLDVRLSISGLFPGRMSLVHRCGVPVHRGEHSQQALVQLRILPLASTGAESLKVHSIYNTTPM